MSGATPGQAPYEAYRAAVMSVMPKWGDLSHQARSGWEAAAQAARADVIAERDKRNRVSDTADQLREQLAATKLALQETSRESSQRGALAGQLQARLAAVREFAVAWTEPDGTGELIGSIVAIIDAPDPREALAAARERSGLPS